MLQNLLAKRSTLLKIIAFSSLLFLSACGYRWHYDYPEGIRPTFSVPFIRDDEDTSLTAEIIASLESSGLVYVVPKDADYRLEVKLVSNRYDQIGYRRDPQKINGKLKKNLLASEGRRTLEAEVTLYRGSTDKIALGPFKLSSESEYDYVDGDSLKDLTFIDKKGNLVEVLPFSLGQLESIESAQEASAKPLHRKLAKKIVDVISAEW